MVLRVSEKKPGNVAQGLAVAFQPGNLLFAGIGVLLGTLVGILPGISPSLTVALLLPVTFKLDPTGSIIMFAGIYFGGMYGSSTSAILLNTPGEAASIATAIEGHRMAKAGRAGPALATAAIGSFVAGTIATIGLAALAPTLVDTHPLLLIAMNARNRNLALTTNLLDPIPYYVVGFTRLVISDPLFYLLGFFYGRGFAPSQRLAFTRPELS